MSMRYGICIAGLSLVLCAAPVLEAQAAATPPPAGANSQDSTNDLTVGVGKSVLLDFPRQVVRVAVGLGDYAVATAISSTEIMINGKAPGETSVIVWEVGGGRQIFDLTVRGGGVAASVDPASAIRREINRSLPGQAIQVSEERGNVFLRGTVKDLNSADRAVQIASTAGKVVNLLDVAVPAAESQILLKVVFASIDRSKATSLGLNLFNLGLGNAVGGITTGQFSPPFIQSSSGSSASGVTANGNQAVFSNELNLLAFFPGLKSGADIQAIETTGVVEVLAQPNVIAQNGKQASFLAGGEYPYPVVQGGSGGAGSSVAIQFKQYGIRLNFIPTITPRGTIHLQVAPEVSSLDFSNAIEVSGFNVPAISTRKMNTEVELSAGQSYIISGLLDNRETETLQKIPFISNIPVLGKLFQSMSKNRTNTELLVSVTPIIVNPIPADTPVPQLKFPEKFLPSNSGIPMNNPVGTPASPQPQEAMPVEKLIESNQKAEKPMVIDGSGTTAPSISMGASH